MIPVYTSLPSVTHREGALGWISVSLVPLKTSSLTPSLLLLPEDFHVGWDEAETGGKLKDIGQAEASG